MTHYIGLDIGHSAVKVACGDNFLFPTAAYPAVELAVDSASESAKDDTVRVGATDYFVGETAVIHSDGRLLNGLSDNWIESDEHHALLIAGYRKAIKRVSDDDVSLALGLPSRLHGTQKENLRRLASTHLILRPQQIAILPQPLAAFYSKLFEEDGMPNESVADDEKWYVIDVGYYTTDFGMIKRGIWSAQGQDSMAGTHVAASKLRQLITSNIGMNITTRDAEVILRTKRMSDQGEMIDMAPLVNEAVSAVAKSIIDGASQVFGDGSIRGAQGIFVAGGGCELMFDAIKSAWKHAVCAENPRYAVAEGLRRYGLARALLAA